MTGPPPAPSLRLRLINLGLRLFEKPRLARETDPLRARRRFRRATRLLLGADVEWGWTRLAGMPCIAAGEGPVLLWFHGGAYVQGSPLTHRKLAQALAREARVRVLLPDYRLAPEHRFPAAPEDALAAYRALLADQPPGRLAVGGDSAGGGLALALVHMIGQAGLPMPAAAVAFSPWADMTLTSPTLRLNAGADPMLPVSSLAAVRDLVLAGADPRDPRASPVFGDFAAAPPALILAGSTEILLGDARATAARMPRASLQVWPEAPHVWPMFYRWAPEARAALRETGAFLAGAFAEPSARPGAPSPLTAG